MSTRAEALPRTLVVGVLVMTLAVLLLGGAVLAVKLRPDSTPLTTQEQTLQNWQQAVEQTPDSDTAQTGLGLALLDMGRTSEAQKAFETAIKLNPKNWMADFQLGLMMRETKPDRAIDLFQVSAKNAGEGDRAVVLIALGDFLLQQGDAEGARDAYRRSIAETSYLYDSHVGLAKALEQLGDTKGAIREYQQALRFAPGDKDLEAAIARLQGKD
jgi:tetratricopeptide (TPR) repeat protein